MHSKHPLSLVAALALTAGCSLDARDKTACNLQTDCLDDHVCVDHRCTPAGGGGPDARGTFYGSVEPLVPQSTGAAAGNYETLVAVTTAPGTLGCAVVGDLEASPGPGAAVVYAKVKPESGDYRCPNGVFAIVDNPELCKPGFAQSLAPQCARYKRWDAAGTQVAFQLAIGGYVSVTDTRIDNMTQRCSVDLSIRFPGEVIVAKTWMFTYNPLAPDSSFCGH